MKIFEGNESSWDEKVNFVDENDVFVGYDIGQCCCEDVGWFMAESLTPYNYNTDQASGEAPNVDSYSFDPRFFSRGRVCPFGGGRYGRL